VPGRTLLWSGPFCTMRVVTPVVAALLLLIEECWIEVALLTKTAACRECQSMFKKVCVQQG
jgi:hypothetical protein